MTKCIMCTYICGTQFKGTYMTLKFQYPLCEEGFWFLRVEVECSIDHTAQWQELVFDLLSVRLQGEMSIRIPEMPGWLIDAIKEQALIEYDKAQTPIGKEIYSL